MMILMSCQRSSSSIEFCEAYHPVYWDEASYYNASPTFKTDVMYNNLIWMIYAMKITRVIFLTLTLTLTGVEPQGLGHI